ncbi:phosphotransferase family protein [Streptomyces sp. NPDC059255]|uniref:phosphotransferase family protein n=1 Tax=Streptomyces sp. NPDC059255 TaxID=3346793 RepID=UPI00369000CB
MSTNEADGTVPAEVRAFLVDHGLAGPGTEQVWQPLTGGVSSALWRVDLGERTICVKGALEKLRVAGDWHAPVTRNAVEWDWLSFASAVAPGQVPLPLAHDPGRGLFAMSYLPVEQYPVWKARLLDGDVRVTDAAALGTLIGQLHAASTRDAGLPSRFATDDNFRQLRVDPYFLAVARRHPGLKDRIDRIVRTTTGTRTALVHGDVSPKNVLQGPSGPVLLDAECAWYGDPAFDVAFALTHLLLKTAVLPGHADALTASALALADAYRAETAWENPADLLARAAHLLPALLLARVDGLSPVEYLDEHTGSLVRAVAQDLLRAADADLRSVVTAAARRLAAPPRSR